MMLSRLWKLLILINFQWTSTIPFFFYTDDHFLPFLEA